jgi:hypothetical protein
MTDAFTNAGFRLAVVSEPQPDPAARELFPDDFHALSTKTSLLFFVVEAPPSAAGSDDWGPSLWSSAAVQADLAVGRPRER